VAAGSHIFIYRNMRPYKKVCVLLFACFVELCYCSSRISSNEWRIIACVHVLSLFVPAVDMPAGRVLEGGGRRVGFIQVSVLIPRKPSVVLTYSATVMLLS
jgi:hypothetical protein